MFQRDCRELLQAGVPLIGNDEGWRLLREEYSLPEVEFTPAEAQILALAGKMGTGEELGAFSRSGWLKLAASGAATEFTTTPSIAPNADLATFNPKAYTTITSAINTRQRISFYYQRDRAADLLPSVWKEGLGQGPMLSGSSRLSLPRDGHRACNTFWAGGVILGQRGFESSGPETVGKVRVLFLGRLRLAMQAPACVAGPRLTSVDSGKERL